MEQGTRIKNGLALAALLAIAGACLMLALPACEHSGSSDDGAAGGPISSSRAYKGHASDRDINNFIAVYPYAYGTHLDNCQTCHWGQPVITAKPESITPNACDYCHLITHPPVGWDDLPTLFIQTLNPYGFSYMEAGRDQWALRTIGVLDADGDGFTSNEEIQALRYPGFASSKPGQPLCPVVTVSLSEIGAMPKHIQFGLGNTSKQQFDFYATYSGVKIKDLLAAKGISTATATGIDILAPDGYAKTFSMDEINNPFPAHQFFSGFGVDDLGAQCAFVEYPAETYGYGYGDTIEDEQWHILAYEREGQPLDPAYLDLVEGKIMGEGPFRNVIPPNSPLGYLYNQPDRGQNWDTTGCTFTPDWDYVSDKDHNAQRMVKSSAAIKIRPMPAGCEEFDIINGGWALGKAQEMIIYGHSVK